MQAGFAMLCAGSVRQKNVKNIMLKNLLDACGGAIGFFSIGYALAYGEDENFGGKSFVGNRWFFLVGYTDYAGWFFQFAFAATAATIVAGTVAERCKMSAYLCYSLFLTGFVYPVVVHSIWCSNGFLTAFHADPFLGVGTIDFAGSGVVHMTGKGNEEGKGFFLVVIVFNILVVLLNYQFLIIFIIFLNAANNFAIFTSYIYLFDRWSYCSHCRHHPWTSSWSFL